MKKWKPSNFKYHVINTTLLFLLYVDSYMVQARKSVVEIMPSIVPSFYICGHNERCLPNASAKKTDFWES